MKDDKFQIQSIEINKSVLVSLVFGGIAGCVAKTAIAPLDRAKINFQTTKQIFTFPSLFEFIKLTCKTNGILFLWRGNSATLTRVFPYAGIQYTANEVFKKLFNVNNYESGSGQNYLNNEKVLLNFLCGSLAGLTSSMFTYPLDLARARMAVTNKNKYKNIIHLIHLMVKEEGVLSLYRGIRVTLIGIIPYCGVGFMVFETLKDHLKDSEGRLKPSVYLAAGSLAGITSQFFCYPLDIVRRRMQTSYVQNIADYSKMGIISSLKLIKTTEGVFRGLYKGFTMNLIKTPTASGISFSIYHTLSDHYNSDVAKYSS